MEVIRDAVDDEQSPVQLADDAAEVGVEALFEGGIDLWFAVLRREHQVGVHRDVAVRHGFSDPCGCPAGMVPRVFCRPLRGLVFGAIAIPRLKPGSIACRPLRGQEILDPGFGRGIAERPRNEPA